MLGAHETLAAIRSAAREKRELGWASRFMLAFLGGAYVSFGALLAVCLASGIAEDESMGSARLAFALLFPFGLIMVAVAGCDLWTSSMWLGVAGWHQDVPRLHVLLAWLVIWIGNLAGALTVVYLLVDLGDVLDGSSGNFLVDIAKDKTGRSFGATFARGILANWLVCVGAWMASSARDLTGRAVGMYVPIAAFVGAGGEHIVANMFFLPAAHTVDAHAVTWADMFAKNFVPSTLGNAAGGLLFVCFMYATIYRKAPRPAPPTVSSEEPKLEL